MVLQHLLAAPAAGAAVCIITYIWTWGQYRQAMSGRRRGGGDAVSPMIPYALPWLGSSLEFLTPYPGRFFQQVLSWHPRGLGSFSVLLGGKRNHIITSPRAVQAIYKLKPSVAHRDHFTEDVMLKGLGLSESDWKIIFESGDRHKNEEMNVQYLLRQSAVNELTRSFVNFFKVEVANESERIPAVDGLQDVGLFNWIRSIMFKASVRSLMGDGMLNIYPGFEADFWEFDNSFLDLLFGVPKLFKPKAYEVRSRLSDNLAEWIENADRMMPEGEKPDPHQPEAEWEPIWGSRISRARQALWHGNGLSSRGRGIMELGFLFGLNSNAIPATGWMLMHILDPKKHELLPRVMREVQRAVIPGEKEVDFQLDISVLITLPLLQSIYTEVLRLYVDVLVSRKMEEDVRLPLEDDGTDGNRTLLLKKGSLLIAPSNPSHYDSTIFVDPPAHVFNPERFLIPATTEAAEGDKKHPQDEYIFSNAASANRLWPYGGGKTMCPGRVFAKQEILAAVAFILLSFDVSPTDSESYSIPGFASVYSGSGAITPGGDVQVNIKLKQKL